MDPLSVTASVLALATAVSATAKSSRGFRNVCKAPELIEELLNELHYLQLLLHQIEMFSESKQRMGHADVLLVPLKCAKIKIDRFNDLLSKPAELRLGKATRCRAIWVLKKHALLHLRNDLHFIKSDLILGLCLMSS